MTKSFSPVLLMHFFFLTWFLPLLPSIYPPGGDNLVKGVQCYELFGGITL